MYNIHKIDKIKIKILDILTNEMYNTLMLAVHIDILRRKDYVGQK